ncbi:integration host factor subunit beta [Candidatus Providencia siddallii]|uniref:Integration host factor subunit beta n=1 Tax=Candidatus Providencia siddallii TaxID=1715285 RepID=A0ABM9NPI8_9GAMM
MTKSKLIEKIANNQSKFSSKIIKNTIKELLEYITNSLASGKRIEIRNFGSFYLHYRRPRIGRNPKTGKQIKLKGKYIPHFKASKILRERINN